MAEQDTYEQIKKLRDTLDDYFLNINTYTEPPQVLKELEEVGKNISNNLSKDMTAILKDTSATEIEFSENINHLGTAASTYNALLSLNSSLQQVERTNA